MQPKAIGYIEDSVDDRPCCFLGEHWHLFDVVDRWNSTLADDLCDLLEFKRHVLAAPGHLLVEQQD